MCYFFFYTQNTSRYILFFIFFFSKLINVVQTQINKSICIPETDVEKSSEKLLYRTTRSLQYIMKFIIRSRILFANLNDDKDRVLFESSLEGITLLIFGLIFLKLKLLFYFTDLLASFIKLVACPNDMLRSQGALLKYIHIIVSDLMQVYDPIRLW